LTGDAENARHENAGLENATGTCRLLQGVHGKCETGKCGTKIQGWKMQEWKKQEKKNMESHM